MPNVRMVKRFRAWEPGEVVAGLQAAAAEAWVELGVAEYADPSDIPLPKLRYESAVDGLAVRIIAPFDIFEPGETLPNVERQTAEAWVSRGVAELLVPEPAAAAPVRAGRGR